MNMRELVGRSLLSSHLETQIHESPIDRVGALGKASDLGRALFHWGYAGDEGAARSALKHLLRKAQKRTKVYKHHRDFGILERVCVMLLHEWRYPHCKACGGAGETMVADVRVICSKCNGTGLHRFSDGERMAAMKVEAAVYRAWQGNIGAVWTCLVAADVGAVVTCREQLERT